MAVGVLNWVISNVQEEQYKIVTLDKKIDSLEVFNKKYALKSVFKRWDLKMNMSLLEKAIYNIAKTNPSKFQELYYDLKRHDIEFFGVATKVLQRIHNEYAFN